MEVRVALALCVIVDAGKETERVRDCARESDGQLKKRGFDKESERRSLRGLDKV